MVRPKKYSPEVVATLTTAIRGDNLLVTVAVRAVMSLLGCSRRCQSVGMALLLILCQLPTHYNGE